MAGKPKFDQEAAFKAIVGVDRQPSSGAKATGQSTKVSTKNKDRVQRSYFIDRDLDKALRRMSLEEEKKLTEAVNEILRRGLEKYL